MRKEVFITRQLSPSSPLLELSDRYVVNGHSLLSLAGLPISQAYLHCDWIFFYSSNGVRFFAAGGGMIAGKKVATIGPATALAVQTTFGTDVHIIGNGKGINTAELLQEHLSSNNKIAFVRAKHSQCSVQKHLSREYTTDIIAYSNTIDLQAEVPDASIVILTSPLNAAAYLEKRDTTGKVVIAIGETTGAYLSKKSITDYLLPEEPTEKSIAKLLQQLS